MKQIGEISQSHCTGGSNVSGGQKQRLSIARAIAKHPELFIFDDSFSALDYKTDVILRRALKEKTKDSTVLIVAQRIQYDPACRSDHCAGRGTSCRNRNTQRNILENCEVYRQIAASQLSEAELNLVGRRREQMPRHGHMVRKERMKKQRI